LDHKFPYKWYLKDGYPESNGLKVFGTFVCGGGSTMGYKLAGFDHLGGVEIDKEVAAVYQKNHKPKHFYNLDIRDFNKLDNLSDELFDLDLLDGSPPCSTFSMAGSREKAWNKKKKFREGQSEQTLDDLVFVYLDTIKRLKPKVVLLENVKGLMQGNAKGYLKEIHKRFTDTGYRVQVFLLNASKMGVPQRRERVFVIGLRDDFKLSKLVLNFNEKPILFGEICDNSDKTESNEPVQRRLWNAQKIEDKGLCDVSNRVDNKNNFFSHRLLFKNKVMPTITAHSCAQHWLKDTPRHPNNIELKLAGSYPLDYDFINTKQGYLIGMSVPPVMTAQIANQINLQWLSKI